MSLGSIFAVGIINYVGVLAWSLTGFGNGLLYQIGYHTCSRLSSFCDGLVSTAVSHITIAATVVFPIQAMYLREYIDWKLVLQFVLSQIFGLVAGLYLLLILDPVFTARLLGIVMCIAAIQRVANDFTMIEDSKTTNSKCETPPMSKYVFQDWKDYTYIWVIGISAGIFGGLYAAGGPPLLYFVSSTNMEKNACRASMSALFTIENIERLLFLFIDHDAKVLNPRSPGFLSIVIVLTITSLAAMITGNSVMDRVSQQLFRRMIDCILVFGSVLLATTDCTFLESLLVVLILAGIYAGVYMYLRNKYLAMRNQMESEMTGNNIVDSFSLDNDDEFEKFISKARRSKTIQMVQTMGKKITSIMTLSNHETQKAGAFGYSKVNTNCEEENDGL